MSAPTINKVFSKLDVSSIAVTMTGSAVQVTDPRTASKWFDMLGMKESPHMTFSFECIADKTKIPSVVHVDGSCRIQTVNKDNKYFYYIIKDFFKKTNIPMLLNTSFNIAGDPMVESPKDAINTLNKSKLKYIYFPEIKTLLTKCKPQYTLYFQKLFI